MLTYWIAGDSIQDFLACIQEPEGYERPKELSMAFSGQMRLGRPRRSSG
jgi:hypothetical protein